MFGLGTTELIIILAVVLIIFGAGKLPEVGRMLGSGIRNFQKSVRGDEESSGDSAKQLEGGSKKKELPD